MKRLTMREWRILRWAVLRAAEWRGSLIGNPDPKPLDQFDAAITAAKAALKKVKP